MKTKFLAVLLTMIFTGAALAAPQAAADKLVSRTFQFRYKQAEKAAGVIRTLVSAEGSVSIQPATNTLVVTDHTANLRQITASLRQFDAPAKAFTLDMKLVSASRAASAAPVPDDLKAISAKLSGVLRFNSFEKVGELVTETKEGDPAVVQLGASFRAEFTMGEYDPVSDSIRVTDFSLGRMQSGAPAEQKQITQLLRTSLNLKVGQTVVLGASRQPESNRALMLVVIASRTE